jgi:predicted ATP-dependent endonuclease of OLD family
MKKVDEDFRNLATKLTRANSNTYSDEFKKACEEVIDFLPATVPDHPNTNQSTIAQYINEVDSISIDQMGDGVTQAIGLLIYLFQSKEKIFLIEEIENDLHPDALKKLLKYIIKASAFNQFIITTHSNIVVRLLGELSETAIFETRSELVKDLVNNSSLFRSSISKLESSVQERVRLLSDLGYELTDYHLWSGFLILEESSAEKVIRDFLIPAFCPKLVHRMRTVASTGAADTFPKFSQLKNLFVFIHISEVYNKRAWVCVDNDAEGKNVVEKLKNSFTTWGEEHFRVFSKTNFEEYYPDQYKDRIEKIMLQKDPKLRGTLKVDLAKNVVDEYRKSPTSLTNLFSKSAHEVISILKEIEITLEGI